MPNLAHRCRSGAIHPIKPVAEGPRIYLCDEQKEYRASPSQAGLPHRTGLVSGSCSSAPRFAAGFFPTPHHCDAVAFG